MFWCIIEQMNKQMATRTKAQDNKVESWKLRGLGFTVRQIARKIGMAPSTVQGYFDSVSKELTIERRKLGMAHFEGEVAVTDTILQSLMEDLNKTIKIDFVEDENGKKTRVNCLVPMVDTYVANAAIKLLDLRAKYFGLYATKEDDTGDKAINLLTALINKSAELEQARKKANSPLDMEQPIKEQESDIDIPLVLIDDVKKVD